MSDLVQQLRGFAKSWYAYISGPAGWLRFPGHYNEAADEIERLEATDAEVEAIADRLMKEASECDQAGTDVDVLEGAIRRVVASRIYTAVNRTKSKDTPNA